MPTLTPRIPPSWQKLFRLLPGYDPVETAEQCDFVAKDAEHAINWIQGICRHVKGSKGGEFFLLEPWEKTIIGCLFGWKRPDGTRRYREVFLSVPRKNGKSPLCACITLYILTNDREPGMECYSAAAEREQAALVYAHAEGMVLQEPELSRRLKVYKTAKSIVKEGEHGDAGD